MKSLVYCVVMVILALFFNLTDGFAQTSGAYKKEFNIDNLGKTYTLDKESLTVAINNVGQYDVVAIQTGFVASSSKTKPITVKAWEISYTQDDASNNPVKASKVENIAPLESSMNFQRGVLTVNALGNTNKRSVVHLELPKGVNTKVYVNGSVIFSGSLSGDGLMVQNSTNLTSKGYSAEAALTQAIIPNTNKPAPTSYKRIDSQTLAAMAIRTVPTPTAFSDSGENWALLQVDVDTTGKVKSILYAGGNEALADISKQYLSQYEFKPFLVNDKPIRVKSLVPVSVASGQIKLFSESK